MTKSSFHKLLLGSVLMLLPFTVQAQVVLKNWTIEDHSGKVKILISSDTLEITAPDGLTLWYNQRLTGDYEIGYRVKMLMQGGKYDRLSDLNCFWGANDPEYPDNLFARSEWRNGIFQHYKTLNLFYVGYGGNHNSTTRFRQYFAKAADTSDAIARPVIKEYTDKAHLLIPNNGTTSKSVWKKESQLTVSTARSCSDCRLKRMRETDISDSAYWKTTHYLQAFR